MKTRFVLPLLLALAAGSAWAEPVEGEVRKLDRAQAKVTLKHGEIRAMDMPAMTMVFRVKDAKMLDGLAEGSKVSFEVEKIDGQFTITRLTPRP